MELSAIASVSAQIQEYMRRCSDYLNWLETQGGQEALVIARVVKSHFEGGQKDSKKAALYKELINKTKLEVFWSNHESRTKACENTAKKLASGLSSNQFRMQFRQLPTHEKLYLILDIMAYANITEAGMNLIRNELKSASQAFDTTAPTDGMLAAVLADVKQIQGIKDPAKVFVLVWRVIGAFLPFMKESKKYIEFDANIFINKLGHIMIALASSIDPIRISPNDRLNALSKITALNDDKGGGKWLKILVEDVDSSKIKEHKAAVESVEQALTWSIRVKDIAMAAERLGMPIELIFGGILASINLMEMVENPSISGALSTAESIVNVANFLLMAAPKYEEAVFKILADQITRDEMYYVRPVGRLTLHFPKSAGPLSIFVSVLELGANTAKHAQDRASGRNVENSGQQLALTAINLAFVVVLLFKPALLGYVLLSFLGLISGVTSNLLESLRTQYVPGENPLNDWFHACMFGNGYKKETPREQLKRLGQVLTGCELRVTPILDFRQVHAKDALSGRRIQKTKKLYALVNMRGDGTLVPVFYSQGFHVQVRLAVPECVGKVRIWITAYYAGKTLLPIVSGQELPKKPMQYIVNSDRSLTDASWVSVNLRDFNNGNTASVSVENLYARFWSDDGRVSDELRRKVRGLGDQFGPFVKVFVRVRVVPAGDWSFLPEFEVSCTRTRELPSLPYPASRVVLPS